MRVLCVKLKLPSFFTIFSRFRDAGRVWPQRFACVASSLRRDRVARSDFLRATCSRQQCFLNWFFNGVVRWVIGKGRLPCCVVRSQRCSHYKYQQTVYKGCLWYFRINMDKLQRTITAFIRIIVVCRIYIQYT